MKRQVWWKMARELEEIKDPNVRELVMLVKMYRIALYSTGPYDSFHYEYSLKSIQGMFEATKYSKKQLGYNKESIEIHITGFDGTMEYTDSWIIPHDKDKVIEHIHSTEVRNQRHQMIDLKVEMLSQVMGVWNFYDAYIKG